MVTRYHKIPFNYLDELKKRNILDLSRALDHLLPVFSSLTKDISLSPTDKSLIDQYNKVKADIRSLSNQLALTSLNAEMDTEVQKLIEALNLKNFDAALEEGKKLAEHMHDQAEMAKLVAQGIEDKKKKQLLLDSAGVLETNSSKLLPVIKAAKNKNTASVNLLNQTITVNSQFFAKFLFF
jgi:hypothetical protein